MQVVKILFKSISLEKEEQEVILSFFTKCNNTDFHYYAIFSEKEHIY